MMRRVFLIIVLSAVANIQLIAGGGIEINLNGLRLAGMGSTGTGLAFNASSAFYNPGALAFTKENHVQFGASLIYSTTNFLAQTPNISEDQDTSFYTPAYFFTSFRKDYSRWTFAIGVSNPFGRTVQWNDVWKGRLIVLESSNRVFALQPTVSYRFNNQFGFGVGLVYAFGNTLLRRGLPVISADDDLGVSEITGTGTSIGYNIGVLLRPDDKLSLGINFRSGFDLAVKDGKAIFEVPNSLDILYPDTQFETTIEIPSVFSIGIGYQPRPKVTLAFDLNLTAWGKVDTFRIDYTENTDEVQDEAIAREYKGTYALRMGMEYKVNDKLQLRGGWYYETSPVQEGFLSPELPDANKVGLTAGTSIDLLQSISIDLSYAYEFSGDRTGTFQQANFGGTYNVASMIAGIGINYSF